MYRYDHREKILEEVENRLKTLGPRVIEGMDGLVSTDSQYIYYFDDGASGDVASNRVEVRELSVAVIWNLKIRKNTDAFKYAREKLRELKKVLFSDVSFGGYAKGITHTEDRVLPTKSNSILRIVLAFDVRYNQRLEGLAA